MASGWLASCFWLLAVISSMSNAKGLGRGVKTIKNWVFGCCVPCGSEGSWEDVYLDDRTLWLDTLGEVRIGLIHSYRLMTNHYHLWLNAEWQSFKGMRHLNGVYTSDLIANTICLVICTRGALKQFWFKWMRGVNVLYCVEPDTGHKW